MKATKQHKKRFRTNLQRFVELKNDGSLNGKSVEVKDRLQSIADDIGLDFDKEIEKLKNTRENPCGCEARENPTVTDSSFLTGLEALNPSEFRDNPAVKPEEIYQMITDMVINTIEEKGHLPWQKSWDDSALSGGKTATNFVSGNPYRGINFFMLNFRQVIDEDGVLTIKMINFDNPYFLTFNQVDDLGGKVKKDSHGQKVVYFTKLYKIDQSDPEIDFGTYSLDEMTEFVKQNYDDIKRTGGRSPKQVARSLYLPILKYYNVFHASDIEGIDWGELPKNENADKPEGFKIKVAEAIYDNFPNAPEVKNIDTRAYYLPDMDYINMPPLERFDQEQFYHTTLFHEATHSTGHKSRLKRDLSGRKGNEKYAFEELVAEMGAVFLCAESGILFRTIDNSAKYLETWNTRLVKKMKDNNKFFFRAASRAQAAADHILDRDDEGIPAYRSDGELKKMSSELVRANPETETICVDDITCDVTVKANTNDSKGGIEIRFSDAPPVEIRDQLKDADFIFYTPKDDEPFWAAEITTKRKKLAEQIAGKFDSAVLKGKKKTVKKTYKDFKKGDRVRFIDLPEEIEGKKNPIIGRKGTVTNSQPKDVDVNVDDYGNTGFLPKNLLKINESQPKDDVEYELGAETTVDFKADGSVQKTGDYAIVEVSALQASHNKDCSANSKHEISRSQPRDRSKEALCAQPSFIAKNLNPASITVGNLAFVGSPVVNANAHAIQGNGRSIALKIAYDEVPESAKKYRKYVTKNAAKFGFDKSQIEKFNQPVLVRMLPVDNEEAIELGNVVDTSQAKMSKIDQAKAYIRNLSDNQLQIIGKLIQESSGETIGAIIDDVGMDIIKQLKQLDRTSIVEKNKLTSEGKEFLRSVLVGLVFDNKSHPNALHHYMKLPHRIKAGLERSFGYIIPLIDNPGDIRDILSRAVEVAAQTNGNEAIDTAKEYASSKDMFEEKNFSKNEIALAQFLLDADTQKFIRNGFRYYDELLEGRETLFETLPPKSKSEAFNIVFVQRARPNPENEAEEILHEIIVQAQRLQTLGNDNSTELKKLDYLLGTDGWKWNKKGTQIIRLNDEIKPFKPRYRPPYGSENYESRKNPPELTADIKRSVLDDFYAWIEGNPLMDYRPGQKTFANWIPYHYPGYQDQSDEIWAIARPAVRANPNARFIYIGVCDKMLIDQGNKEPTTLQGPHGLLTNKAMTKLFIVPFSQMDGVDDEINDLKAEQVFAQWHNYAADDTNYEVNWPDNKKAFPVGTADSIYYVSDKVMREYDGKGKMNVYHHDFDAGKRPCVKKGQILIVSNLDINENGILN